MKNIALILISVLLFLATGCGNLSNDPDSQQNSLGSKEEDGESLPGGGAGGNGGVENLSVSEESYSDFFEGFNSFSSEVEPPKTEDPNGEISEDFFSYILKPNESDDEKTEEFQQFLDTSDLEETKEFLPFPGTSDNISYSLEPNHNSIGQEPEKPGRIVKKEPRTFGGNNHKITVFPKTLPEVPTKSNIVVLKPEVKPKTVIRELTPKKS